MACGILVSQLGIKPLPPAGEVWSHNYWTTGEVPHPLLNFLSAALWGLRHKDNEANVVIEAGWYL